MKRKPGSQWPGFFNGLIGSTIPAVMIHMEGKNRDGRFLFLPEKLVVSRAHGISENEPFLDISVIPDFIF